MQALRRTLRLVRKVLRELMMIFLIVYTLSRLIARIFD
ncbi:spore coat polysaccharide biosynthesis protein SpsF (cytidylyltransferase family) [Schaalia hyovaginalis]|uniref:Spore coat polysaccharide biosynthesis protein SpsF (Cytidylyltransferase family) n=1 Tax=Schaalia hyovaginalis TaxID=29316 RepID=A0A923E471_9ACTO|nr:spore coat polysaccharide biosynthesis protein SpsF (cytidylyltransferase family) [Schaalia hyovaginalis]